MRSDLLLFITFLQAKSAHFSRNPYVDFDQQRASWFESDFCVSCASYITTLLTTIFIYTVLIKLNNVYKITKLYEQVTSVILVSLRYCSTFYQHLNDFPLFPF